MKMKFAAIVAAGALVAACNNEEAGNPGNDVTADAAVNDAAPPPHEENAALQAAATPAGDLSAQYMVGKWSAMGEDCSATLDFSNDGKVVTPIGEAKWTLAGDKLTLDYGDDSKPTTSTLKSLSADRIEITTASGRKETQKRC